MDIQSTKLDLINWLSSLTDESIISKLYAIKNNNTKDWYDDLTKAERQNIQKGLNDLNNGNIHSNEEVKLAVRNKIQELKQRS